MGGPDERFRVAPVLGVRDVRAAVDYYRGVLGFTCDPEHGIQEGVGEEAAVYAILHRGGQAVHLQIRRRVVYAEERGSFECDAYFYVEDADALYEEVRDRGARFVRDPADSPYGLRDFVVEDPDGHRLVFGSPLPA